MSVRNRSPFSQLDLGDVKWNQWILQARDVGGAGRGRHSQTPTPCPVSGARPSMLSKGGRILLRPFHQLLCQPLWSGLIKWRLSSCSPSHNRLWCEAHIITMTGWLPISALLLSWENAPHASPAGGKNLSGLSVILSRPEIAVNHHPSFHCGRNPSRTCHLCTSPPIQKSWLPVEHTRWTLIGIMR